MKRFASYGVVGSLVAVAGCGGTPESESVKVEASAIVGGQEQYFEYPAVGCLQGNGTCTGTLIAPNLVLSAKHCGAMTTFNTGAMCSTIARPEVQHIRTIDKIIPYYPDESPVVWTDPDLYPHDLAIYHLSSPIYDVRPLQLNPEGYPADGTTCVAVGFGLNNAGVAGSKRAATVSVAWSGELIYGYQGLGYTLMHSAIEVELGPYGSSPPPGMPESGDSGSPLLCNGNGVIRGVFAGHLYYPATENKYYTGIEGGQTWDSAWVTSVASNYVNEPMVSVTSWGENRFDLFIRGTDGAIWTKIWDKSLGLNWDNSYWYPSQFGWWYQGGFITGTPEAVAWGPNRIDVFVRGGDPDPKTNTFNSMALHHHYWDGSSWNWQQLSTAGLASHPVAVSWGVSRLDVFALLSNGYIYHWYSNDGTSWVAEAIPTDGGPTTFLPLMKAFSTSSGTLDLYAVGTDNTPYHNRYNSYGEWSGWENLGGQVMGTPAVTSWGGGRQDIFFKGTDTNLYQKTYIGGVWGPSQQGYWSMGGPIDGSPAAASMQFNWLTLVSNAPSGHADKGWFNGSQWAPSNDTWRSMGGITNGAPTLVAVPNKGLNLFTVGGTYSPCITSRTLNTDWGGCGPLGGTASW